MKAHAYFGGHFPESGTALFRSHYTGVGLKRRELVATSAHDSKLRCHGFLFLTAATSLWPPCPPDPLALPCAWSSAWKSEMGFSTRHPDAFTLPDSHRLASWSWATPGQQRRTLDYFCGRKFGRSQALMTTTCLEMGEDSTRS